MKLRLVLSLTFLLALALSAFVLEAAPTTFSFEGCWSYFSACSTANDIYRDSTGQLWQCSRCGTTKNPSPKNCHPVTISGGYWCS